MLHNVRQLDANFVCLLFDVVQVMYSKISELFCWKQQPTESEPKQ